MSVHGGSTVTVYPSFIPFLGLTTTFNVQTIPWSVGELINHSVTELTQIPYSGKTEHYLSRFIGIPTVFIWL